MRDKTAETVSTAYETECARTRIDATDENIHLNHAQMPNAFMPMRMAAIIKPFAFKTLHCFTWSCLSTLCLVFFVVDFFWLLFGFRSLFEVPECIEFRTKKLQIFSQVFSSVN